MISKREKLNIIDYLNIILKATNNLKNLIIKGKTNIQILYGEDEFNKYFIQFLIEEYEDDDVDVAIAEGINTLDEAFTIGETLSDLYDLELVEF